MSGIRLRIRQRVCLGMAMLAATIAAAPVYAQDSHWGVGASIVPKWTSIPTFKDMLFFEGGGDLTGNEIAIGLVRGSVRGGDWGVSFIQKRIDDTTAVDVQEFSDDTFLTRTTYTEAFRDVRLRGVEFHAFLAFVTIAERVQIGLNLAGGIATASGTVDTTIEFLNRVTFPDGTVQQNIEREEFTDDVTASIQKYQPLGKVELQGAVILPGGLKVRVAGGFNAPGLGMRISAVYLFGAR